MPELNLEASKTALELMKQLTTLNSAVLVLSGTFINNLLPVNKYLLLILGFAWLSLIFSLYFSIKTMSSIVQSQLRNKDYFSVGKGRRCGVFSKNLFFIGVVLLIVFASVSTISNIGTKDGEVKKLERLEEKTP